MGHDREGEGARPLTPYELRARAETLAPADERHSSVVPSVGAYAASVDSLRGTLAVSESVLSVRELATAPTEEARYLRLRELGHGGMGRVDVVFDRALGRPVAQKSPIDASVAPLLAIEAQIGAQLEHPSIVPVYDVGRDASGKPNYTMRVVNGRTLRDVLEDEHAAEAPRKLGLAQLLGILRQVCLAVDYAHSRGVVHRDLKPENVVVGEFGEVYVLDWGVAYLTEASDIRLPLEHQRDVTIAGSPGYMAPEQALGGKLDGRADVYALGVMLYEMLAGHSPFEHERDLSGVVARIIKPTVPPPSLVAPGSVPAAFDDVVRGCLHRDIKERVASARTIVETIDRFLDAERDRLEREREAESRVADGQAARTRMEELEREAAALAKESEALLADQKPWEPAEAKEPAWQLAEQARRLGLAAARERARAESAFTSALSRVPEHDAARAGLAGLHFKEFLAAEEAGDAERMAQHLELARSYDDGPLALELADEGALEVELVAPDGAEAHVPVALSIARYEARGMRLCLTEERPIERGRRMVFGCGSYLVRARRRDGGEHEPEALRYPIVLERAKLHVLRLRLPAPGEVPEGMVLIPGGPFLALPPGAQRLVRMELPDFAIGRFPVTFREYVRFLDEIEDEGERARRTPGHEAGPLLERTPDGAWVLAERAIEGAEARARVPRERELDVPVFEVTWYNASAYARWLSLRTKVAYRLPTDLEWDKAMRGADGRKYPMGNHLDAAFAKLRASRPEATQLEPIGVFSHDESPFGVRDLAGGVGDWTSSMLDGLLAPEPAKQGDPAQDGRQAYWRGGNWGSSGVVAGMRYPMGLDRRSSGTGFRLSLALGDMTSSTVHVEALRS